MTLDLRDWDSRDFISKFLGELVRFEPGADLLYVHHGTEFYNKVILSDSFRRVICFSCLHNEYIFTSDNERLIVII